eukprot:12427745-Karenia_brevis.AAC.1
MTVCDLADRLLAEDSTRAAQLGLPRWPRETSNDAALLGHALVEFLSAQGAVVERFLAFPIGANVALTAGDDNKNAVDVMLELLGIEDVQTYMGAADSDCVQECLINCKTLLEMPYAFYKYSSVRGKLRGGKRAVDVSFSLLHIFGFICWARWKAPGVRGGGP